MGYVLSIFLNALQTWLYTKLWDSFFIRRFSGRKFWSYWLLWTAITTVIINVLPYDYDYIASLVLLLPLGALIVGWGGTLFYTFVFRFLRARTGGYHAKTPHGCLLGSVCCQSVMLFLSAHMPDPVVSAFIAGFSCLSIALFGPANHPELHLSEKELKALQPRIYIRLLIVVALTAVLLFFRPDWGACTAFGVFAAALLLVISLQGYGAQ